MRYRFTLEKYKGARTRYACPNCGKAGEFTRYIDIQTGRHIADHVGRCNREVSCGYHYTPKQYFAVNQTYSQVYGHRLGRAEKLPPYSPKPISFIPFETFYRSLSAYTENNFVQYLRSLFGAGITNELIRRFYIGTSTHWKGATIFWQIDIRGRIRSGKIILYNATTGRRVKYVQPDGGKLSKITWQHSIMQKQGAVKDYNLRQCLFGEHQLASQPKSKPVAVVEAEKTAIIASVYLPNFTWLACGSVTNLTDDKCRVLAGRNAVLFPDLNCFAKWRYRAKHLSALPEFQITVSDLLERRASEADKEQGFDLADYLVRFKLNRGEFQ